MYDNITIGSGIAGLFNLRLRQIYFPNESIKSRHIDR